MKRYGLLTIVFLYLILSCKASVAASTQILILGPDQASVSLGLICDGHTDNAPTFRKLNSILAENDRIILHDAPLPCMTSMPLVLLSNTSVEQTGASITLESTEQSDANPRLLKISGASDVHVRGITFDGGWKNNQYKSVLIVVYKSSHVGFENVTVQHSNGVGMVFSDGVVDSGVEQSRFLDLGGYQPNKKGIENRQSLVFSTGTKNSGNYVESSDFSRSGLDEISVTDQDNIRIERNSLEDTSGGACIYGAGNDSMEIKGNTCSDASGNGIDLFKNKTVNVSSNILTKNGASGIAIADTAQSVVVVGNVVSDNGTKGGGSAGILISKYKSLNIPQEILVQGNSSRNARNTKQCYGLQMLNVPQRNSYVVVDNKFAGDKREEVFYTSSNKDN